MSALPPRQPLQGGLGRRDPISRMGKLRSREGFDILAGNRCTVRRGQGELNEGLFAKVKAGLRELRGVVESPEAGEGGEIVATFRPSGPGDVEVSRTW